MNPTPKFRSLANSSDTFVPGRSTKSTTTRTTYKSMKPIIAKIRNPIMPSDHPMNSPNTADLHTLYIVREKL